MYAIIKTCGRQYKAEIGKFIDINFIEDSMSSNIFFNNVLLFSDGKDIKLGSPYINGCKVVGILEKNIKAKKISIIKIKRRKHHLKKIGYRDSFYRVKIISILFE